MAEYPLPDRQRFQPGAVGQIRPVSQTVEVRDGWLRWDVSSCFPLFFFFLSCRFFFLFPCKTFAGILHRFPHGEAYSCNASAVVLPMTFGALGGAKEE